MAGRLDQARAGKTHTNTKKGNCSDNNLHS